MPSNAATGAHYKTRSKRWLERQGKTVFDMEIARILWTSHGPIPQKRDQLGADLGYLDTAVVVFVQVKGGVTKSNAVLVRDAQRAFGAYRFPSHCRCELHIWRRMAREPEVIVCPS